MRKGEAEKMRLKDQYNTESMLVTAEKNKAKVWMIHYRTRSNVEQYKKKRRTEVPIMRKEKRSYERNRVAKMEALGNMKQRNFILY